MSKPARGLDAKSYRTVGTTHDGVSILKPKTKPVHFTTREIRTTIRDLKRRDSTAALSSNPAGTRAVDL